MVLRHLKSLLPAPALLYIRFGAILKRTPAGCMTATAISFRMSPPPCRRSLGEDNEVQPYPLSFFPILRAVQRREGQEKRNGYLLATYCPIPPAPFPTRKGGVIHLAGHHIYGHAPIPASPVRFFVFLWPDSLIKNRTAASEIEALQRCLFGTPCARVGLGHGTEQWRVVVPWGDIMEEPGDETGDGRP